MHFCNANKKQNVSARKSNISVKTRKNANKKRSDVNKKQSASVKKTGIATNGESERPHFMNSTQSTQGDAANAENKPRPDRILPWPEFEAEQAHTWGILMESSFVRERHFTSQRTSLSMGDP
ncbi:hypothetical protein M430DRAFT_19120 [Amorphotheca resinae ATCC 22711]|uniref:Uncharacterized protein n=1 Tax=Amorphotheca resinae ATCC 22711 TaxID=857342 RepID=A0A2T3B1T4_AMORE|nr:hypothetical protein M430DRAFT_19120 [Amorphotheca resinae ATCC 22711]PSS18522.1 hypothetical protein M430DRAFT_19120 [Amorphotheca resinae ATCC 22711]